MLRPAQHDQTDRVIPNASDESKVWMLRSAQHDKSGKHGCFTSFSMTSTVIPHACEESSMDASLRSA